MNTLHQIIGCLGPTRLKIPALCLALLPGASSSVRADGGDIQLSIPPALQVPVGNTLAYAAKGVGVQIYVWAVNHTNALLSSWVFQAPHAVLFGEGLVGIHYAGPTWQNDDGSKVAGARVASVTVDSNAIPWLLLRAASTSGPGIFSDITYIQRLRTEGGLAPITPGLVDGQQVLVPYSAQYLFYRAQSPVFSADSRPYGATYQQWAARFWQRKLSLPVDAASEQLPLSAGQSGPVWVLARPGARSGGVLVETNVFSVPAGKALLVEALGEWADDSDCPTFDPFTEIQLRNFLSSNWGAVSQISCTLDGVTVPGTTDPRNTPYLIGSRAFSYTLADHDNVLGVDFGLTCIPDGTTIDGAVDEGVFLMFAPLPVGHHTIHTLGVVGPAPSPFVVVDSTYEITVTPRHAVGGPIDDEKSN